MNTFAQMKPQPASELEAGCEYLQKYLERMQKGGGFGLIWSGLISGIRAELSDNEQKTACFVQNKRFNGAAARIRTGDLILTKGRGVGRRRRYTVICGFWYLEKYLERHSNTLRTAAAVSGMSPPRSFA